MASAKMANRLIEAHERNYWTPEPSMLDALRRAGDELEDRLEGIGPAVRTGSCGMNVYTNPSVAREQARRARTATAACRSSSIQP